MLYIQYIRYMDKSKILEYDIISVITEIATPGTMIS